MSTTLISNPPYNMKWTLPPFAQIQPRFNDCELPPESNANYAFILTGLSMVEDKEVFLLPTSVLTTQLKQEQLIRQYLLDIEMVRFEEIFLPYIETQTGQTIYERLEEKQFLLEG